MKRVALAVALLIGLATPSQADYQAGVAAYSRGDYATALQEFKPLAEQGIAEAQFSLGLMYWHGRGVPQDSAEAAKWYRLAAEQGQATTRSGRRAIATAQFSLGAMHADGAGVPQDYILAHMWFSLAGSRFPPGPDRDFAAKYRDFAATKLTPAQIAEAQRLAREWKPKRSGR